MTQRMEKYFGFKVSMQDHLEPADIEYLKAIAEDLAAHHRIDTTKYLVYFHHLQIQQTSVSHFGFEGDVSQRIAWINLIFEINKKQVEDGSLRFFNSHVPDYNMKSYSENNIRPSYADERVAFQIPARYFQKYNYFKSAIITFLNKEIRLEHRKVTATVDAMPSNAFAPHLKLSNIGPQQTKLVVRFSREIQLRLPLTPPPKGSNEQKMEVHVTKNYTNYGRVGAFGDSADASNFTMNFAASVEAQQLKTLLETIEIRNHTNMMEVDALRRASTSATREEAVSVLSKVGHGILTKADALSLPFAADVVKEALKENS